MDRQRRNKNNADKYKQLNTKTKANINLAKKKCIRKYCKGIGKCGRKYNNFKAQCTRR